MASPPLTYWGITIYARSFQTTSDRSKGHHVLLSTLHLQHITVPDSVWAFPSSIASTKGISFDFSSSRYSDASFPTVYNPNNYEGIAGRIAPPRMKSH